MYYLLPTLNPLASTFSSRRALHCGRTSAKSRRRSIATGMHDKQCKFDVASFLFSFSFFFFFFFCQEADNNLRVNVLANVRRRIFTSAVQIFPETFDGARMQMVVVNPTTPASLSYKGLSRSSRPITSLGNLGTMEPTYLFVAYLLAGLAASVPLTHDKDEKDKTVTSVTEDTITEDLQRVHQECRNPDYKQYVKCLMRPKRHHHTDRSDQSSEIDAALCLGTCLNKCDHQVELDCETKCSHCTKRIRYKHHFSAEFEKECESGKCISTNGAKNGAANITTNIGINNTINPESIYPPPWYPSIPIIPQVSLVPQITYGVGAMGGCAFNQWLCIQQTGVQIPPSKPDCSGCGSSTIRYRCDVSCYTMYNMTKTTCKSPSCIGGT